MKTKLFALLNACDHALIDGYEVEEFGHLNDEFHLEWCGGDDRASFVDQEVEISFASTIFQVADKDGVTYEMTFYGCRSLLTPADVLVCRQRERIAFVEAYAASDFGDGPSFAKLVANSDFVVKLRQLAALCVTHRLSELRTYDSPSLWGPRDIEGELRLNCGELVVTPSSFWFVDQPKHASYHIETRAIEIEAFCESIASAPCNDPLYFGDQEASLKDAVIEDGHESGEEEGVEHANA